MKSYFSGSGHTRENEQTHILANPQFWSIVSIFVLITLHHYDDQAGFLWFAKIDLPLGLTRHTIDRILYLVPVVLSSFIFGRNGGFIALATAFLVMIPRAIFISATPMSAILETITIMLIGSIAPIWSEYHKRQKTQLEVAVEQLELTQRELQAKAQIAKEQEKQLAVIDAFSSMLTKSLRVRHVISTAVDMVIDVMQVDVVLIFSLDEQEGKLRIKACKGISEQTAQVLDGMELGKGLCGNVAKTGTPLLVEDACNDPMFCDVPIHQENLHTELSVPLVAEGNIVGTLCVATRTHREFKEPDIKLLTALGNLIGVAMNTSRLYHEREEASEQLKVSVQQLAVSEQKYRQIFENAHVAIWVQDMYGKITAANNYAAMLFGYALSDFIGMDIRQFLSTEDLVVARAIKEDLLNGGGGVDSYTQGIVRTDGTKVYIRLTPNLISDNGHPEGFQFIGRDMTKEIRMQENQSFYMDQITKAHEEERLRISRDLHDSTAQTLIAILHQSEIFCKTNKKMPKSELDFVQDLNDKLRDLLKEIRQLSRDLRPSIIDDLGLIPAVEWLVEQQKSEHHIEASLKIVGPERRFSQEIEVTVFRIIQEALRNIARHADSTRVHVLIENGVSETVIAITDNGKGFKLPASIGELSRRGKLGLDGMQTRARLVGGTFDIYSEKDRGTTITVTIPVSE